jgi:hypothetical protein
MGQLQQYLKTNTTSNGAHKLQHKKALFGELLRRISMSVRLGECTQV